MRRRRTSHRRLGTRRASALLAFGTVAATLSLVTSSSEAVAQPVLQTLSPEESSARDARVAVDPDGDAVVLFFYGDEVRGTGPPAYCKLDDFGEETNDCTVGSRSWSTDGTWSPLQDLSAPFSGRMGEGDVAMDGQGRTVAVWAGTSQWGGLGGTVARARSAGGSWSGGEILSPDPHHPQVAVDGQGRAVVAWLHPVQSGFLVRFQIQARARAANGTLSAVQDLSTAGVDAWNPQVAVDADGDALFVWQAQLDAGSGRWTIQARARSADGTLSPTQNLSPAGVDGWNPRVEVDADGDALVVWQLGLGNGIQARSRTADGTLSPVQTLSPAGRGGDSPQVDMLDDGRALVVWSGREPNWDTRVRARARSAAGTWAPMQTVSLPASLGEVFGPQVAMDDGGRALVVWTQVSGASLYEPLQIRSRSPQGKWSAVRNLSEPRTITWQAQMDVSPAGRAVVAWEEYWSFSNHYDWGPAIRAATLTADDLPPDLTPPGTTITAGPRGTTTRRSVSFRFRATQAGSAFRCKLDLGAWRPCSSPRSLRNLAFGRHVFRVRAIDPSGNADPTPARRAFRVVRG